MCLEGSCLTNVVIHGLPSVFLHPVIIARKSSTWFVIHQIMLLWPMVDLDYKRMQLLDTYTANLDCRCAPIASAFKLCGLCEIGVKNSVRCVPLNSISFTIKETIERHRRSMASMISRPPIQHFPTCSTQYFHDEAYLLRTNPISCRY